METEIKTEEVKSPISMIERAEAAAKAMQEANKVHEALIQRQEAMKAEDLLGGRSIAGQPSQPQMSEEEKLRQETKTFFKGSAIEKAFR